MGVGVNMNIRCWHQHSSESGEMGDGNPTDRDGLLSNVVYLSAKALKHLEAANAQVAEVAAKDSAGKWCGEKKYLCDKDDNLFQLRRMPDSDSNDGFTFTIRVKGDGDDGPVKFKTDSQIDDLDIFELEALSLAEHVPSVDQGQEVNVTSVGDGSLMVKKKASAFYNFKGFLNSLPDGKLQTLEQVMKTEVNATLKSDTICV